MTSLSMSPHPWEIVWELSSHTLAFGQRTAWHSGKWEIELKLRKKKEGRKKEKEIKGGSFYKSYMSQPFFSKENENTFLYKVFYINICRRFICNIPKLKQPCVYPSVNG